MELIPILSTIILVATISTFLLAIGAYVLYKVRERRGQQAAAPQPTTVKAELITPMEMPFQQEQIRKTPQPVFIENEPETRRQPLFVQQSRAGYQSIPQKEESQPRQYTAAFQPRGVEAGTYKKTTEKNSEKFYKYSSEGYINPKEDKQAGALRWR